jgi:hypothetical protein
VPRTELISSSRSRLVIESPPGVVRWSTSGCDVGGRGLKEDGPRGGFGGACIGPDAYLFGSVGELGSGGRSYLVAYGRTLPIGGVFVRLTLVDGRQIRVQAHEGLWMQVIVAEPIGNYCLVKTIEAVAPDGHVLSKITSCPS